MPKFSSSCKTRLASLAFYCVFLASFILTACSGKTTLPPAAPTATPALLPAATASPTPLIQPTATNIPYQIAIQVGKKSIYLPEYEAALRQIDQAQQALSLSLPIEEQQRLVINALVDEALLAQAAMDQGYTRKEQELKAAYDLLVSASPRPGEHSALSGYTQDFVLVALHRALAAAWMRDQILSAVPEQAEQVRARQIVAATREEALQIIEQARQPGADFSALAYTYDPYTGGDLGWFARGVLFFSQVEEAAFALQPGDSQHSFSDPVQTPLGYHILHVTARETRPLPRFARLALQRQAMHSWLQERRSAVSIEVRIQAASLSEANLSEIKEARPVYAVQEGDTYYTIAERLRVPVQALIDANPAYPPEALGVGSDLVIPGVSGAEGSLVAVKRPEGLDLVSIARAYRLSPELLARLNHLTSPLQHYVNSILLVPEAQANQAILPLGPVSPNQSLLERATIAGLTPWDLALASGAYNPAWILPGEALFRPIGTEAPGSLAAPEVTLNPLSLVQGRTLVMHVPALEGSAPTGRLNDSTLHFFPSQDGWTALQGLHAMAEPGLALLSIQLDTGSSRIDWEEALPLYPGNFPQDPPLTVDPLTIDPAITGPEEAQLLSITADAGPQRYWEGSFRPPVDSPGCTRSMFGNRRSFNDSPYQYFHSGLDYGVCAGLDIYAPAPGKVVFAGPLDVRGNATVIDHGWGVYSGYWHQSEIRVTVGDQVQTGQVIGQIGNTGRITGEHLHWEIWVGGIQVDPIQWLDEIFPR